MTFALHPDITVWLRRIGNEAQPLMVVDHVLADPNALIDAAKQTAFYVSEHTKYPGLNAPLPEGYYQTVVTALRGPIEAAFGLPRDAWVKFFGFFALATTPADQAEPIQKIPHSDGPHPERLAMVHYLCRGDFGGTGFFRHRSTGFESVDAGRQAAYIATAKPELAAAEPAGYADTGMAHYELTGEAEMVFNRMIIYRSHVLHSGLLNRTALSHDPVVGRLTANGFLEVMTVP